MIRGLCALVAASVLSGFAYLLVTGRYTKEGPTVLEITAQHGVHLGDLFVLGGWLVGMLALLVGLCAPPRRRAPVEGARVQAR